MVYIHEGVFVYGMATISWLLKMIGLSGRSRSLL